MEPHLKAESLRGEAENQIARFLEARKRMAQAVERAREKLDAALGLETPDD